MTDTLLLVGRSHTRTVAQTHADRLRARDVADRIVVETYDRDPTSLDIAADSDAYVVPMAPAPDRDTVRAIPGALPAAIHCTPVGTNPQIARGLVDRARSAAPERNDTSLALVAFGNGSISGVGSRETTQAHAERLREATDYGEVTTAYLLQNPAVECLRYNLSGERAVVVPFFLAACEETTDAITEALELDRGGLEYTAPLGTHEAVTDAIEAEFEAARSLGATTAATQPVATDGRGH